MMMFSSDSNTFICPCTNLIVHFHFYVLLKFQADYSNCTSNIQRVAQLMVGLTYKLLTLFSTYYLKSEQKKMSYYLEKLDDDQRKFQKETTFIFIHRPCMFSFARAYSDTHTHTLFRVRACASLFVSCSFYCIAFCNLATIKAIKLLLFTFAIIIIIIKMTRASRTNQEEKIYRPNKCNTTLWIAMSEHTEQQTQMNATSV